MQLATAEPGLARAVVTVDDNGLYRAVDAERFALVNVGPENPLALREVLSTTEKLKPIAESTGGGVFRLAEKEGDPPIIPRLAPMRESQLYAGPDYAGLKRTGASVLIGVQRTSLAADIIGLIVLLGALVGMWLREGWPARRRA